MVQCFLSLVEFKMDFLVLFYYFVLVCVVMNFVVVFFWEFFKFSMQEVYDVGFMIFFFNGLCVFVFNVLVVFLVSFGFLDVMLCMLLIFFLQIGKIFLFVFIFCGVFKDVFFVVVFMIIWGIQVIGFQFFGYSIVFGGMVYYKFGYEVIKGYVGEVGC